MSVVYSIGTFIISGCARPPAPQAELPDFALTAVTVDGTAPLDRGALLGRAWIASFVFTRCSGPCPLLTASMAGLQKRLPASVGLLSFTVDPDHDGPEVLTLYAGRHKADPQRWLFVTGDKPALHKLYRDGFKIPVVENPKAPVGEMIAHSTKFILVDDKARIRGWYDGTDPGELARLERDAKAL